MSGPSSNRCCRPFTNPVPAAVGRGFTPARSEGIFYTLRSGAAWRMMPKDLPPWPTVYGYFRRWRLDGTWERSHTALRERTRLKADRHADPTAAILDSQSVRTSEKRGVRGYDGHKKLPGRKRHALVDTSGLLLGVKVLPANQTDRSGGAALLSAVRNAFPRLQHVWADQGYKGQFQTWVKDALHLDLEVVYPWWRQLERYLPGVYEQLDQGFKVIARRWVVERTFAWWTFQRRLNRDYELLPACTECFIYATMIRLMVRRLAC